MKRSRHWIRRNPGTKLPTSFLFVSTTTQGRGLNLAGDPQATLSTVGLPSGSYNLVLHDALACRCTYRAGEGWTTETWLEYDNPLDFWRDITDGIIEPREILWVVGQEIGISVRLLDAFRILSSFDWKGERVYLTGKTTLVSFRKSNQKIKFLESQNIFRFTLPELAHDLGLPWHNGDGQGNSATPSQDYNRQSIKVLKTAWAEYLGFLATNDLGQFSISLASQAFNAYRHRFMTKSIGISDIDAQCRTERAAYHGGRVQPLRVGEFNTGETFYKLDINGAYAWAMQNFLYPAKCIKFGQGYDPTTLLALLKHHLIVAEVVLETQSPAYPVKLDKRILYPTGVFKTTLTTPELKFALAEGSVKAVGRVQLYEPADLFSTYVQFFTAKRAEFAKQGRVLWATLAKQFRNSLYGKFGQRGYEQKIVGQTSPDTVFAEQWLDSTTREWFWRIGFGGRLIEDRQTGESQDSFPAIAAHITANVRMRLYELVQIAEPEHVFYVDTDALIVAQRGYKNLMHLIHPSTPGMLKVEGKGKNLSVFASKWYEIGATLTTGGIKANAIRLGRVRFLQEEVQGLRASLRARNAWTVKARATRRGLDAKSAWLPTDETGRIETPCLAMSPDELVSLTTFYRHPSPPAWWIDTEWLGDYARRRAKSIGLLEVLYSPPGESNITVSSQTWRKTKARFLVNSREFADLDHAIDAAWELT